ncbi:hypothetical protein [Micromonospora costi]|nr:hypothetical protein [Micromonospora costi]
MIAALHGGHTGRYFDVDGYGSGSILDLASSRGYPVASSARLGFGDSFALPPAENAFARHAVLLAAAIGQARQVGTDRVVAAQAEDVVFSVARSIGGMISMIAMFLATAYRGCEEPAPAEIAATERDPQERGVGRLVAACPMTAAGY